MTRYVAIVDGGPGAYGVVVPDFPGCTSGGDTIDDALSHAVEAVRLWADDAISDGEKLPKARDAESLKDDPKLQRLSQLVRFSPPFRSPWNLRNHPSTHCNTPRLCVSNTQHNA